MKNIVLHDNVKVGNFGNVYGNAELSGLLGEIHKGMGHWGCMVHTAFCTCFVSNDIVVDIGVDLFEGFDISYPHLLWGNYIVPTKSEACNAMVHTLICYSHTQHLQHPHPCKSRHCISYGVRPYNLDTLPFCFMLCTKLNIYFGHCNNNV